MHSSLPCDALRHAHAHTHLATFTTLHMRSILRLRVPSRWSQLQAPSRRASMASSPTTRSVPFPTSQPKRKKDKDNESRHQTPDARHRHRHSKNWATTREQVRTQGASSQVRGFAVPHLGGSRKTRETPKPEKRDKTRQPDILTLHPQFHTPSCRVQSPESGFHIPCSNPRCGNDPSAGSPTETLLRLHLPLNDKV